MTSMRPGAREVAIRRVASYRGCLGGDCPHDTQQACDKALADEVRRDWSC